MNLFWASRHLRNTNCCFQVISFIWDGAKQRSATSLSPICAFSSILEHRDEQQTFWSCCDYSCLIIRMPDLFHLGGMVGTSCQNPPPPGVLRQGEMRNPSQFGDRRPLMKRVAQKNPPRLGARVAYAGIDLRGRSSKMRAQSRQHAVPSQNKSLDELCLRFRDSRKHRPRDSRITACAN
jgi:hypothetical protein